VKKYDISELNDLYKKAEDKDATLFSEMKSNVLLVNSEHYKQIERNRRNRAEDREEFGKQKVRITKNHIYRLTQRYKNGIMGLSPDLMCYPANPNELSDKKSAELFNAVLQYGKDRYKLLDKQEDWCEDYVDMGEVACKTYFDKNRGDIVGYRQATTEEGNPIFLGLDGKPTLEASTFTVDPTGMGVVEQPHKPLPDDEQPVFNGDFVFETILPFNLLRDPEAESMDESPYVIVRKMVDIEDAKLMIPKDDPNYEEKLEYITTSAETTYKVFDTDKGAYEDGKNKVMLREYYFKKCMKYPKGYFYITTDNGVLFEGELPFEVFPIAWRGFKKIQTSARARSIVKILRPYQYELNRMASKEIEHSIIHGDDKVITPPGGKVSQGAMLPGIRQFHAVGAPTVIPGRTGEQFAAPQQRILAEMYQVVDEEVETQDAPSQMDANALLYRSLQRKAKYGKYAKGFQEFIKEVYWIYLELAKHYFDEKRYIKAVGRNEVINFAEFKSSDKLSVQIKMIEDNQDNETLLGKSIQMNYILQYVGKDLPKEALGQVLTNLPYANKDQIFDTLLVDFKNIENDLLALDRGEPREASADDENDKYIKALTYRMKQPDFKLLPPQVQQMYMMVREQHRQFQAQKEQQILLAQQQAIPSGGNLVKVDMYIMKDNKQVRATFPDEALKWLQDKLAQQGLAQERLSTMATVDQAEMAQMMMLNQQAPQMPMNQGGMNGPNGEPIY
jgi:hypothetical protein